MDHMFWSTETGELVKVSTIQNGVVYLVNGEEYDIEAFVKEFVELDPMANNGQHRRLTGPELWRRVKTIEYLENYLLTNGDEGVLDCDTKDELRILIDFYEGKAK